MFSIGLIFVYHSTIKPQLEVATGYAAKKMCSCYFIVGRSQESIQSQDLDMPFTRKTSTIIDVDHKKVTTSFYGLASRSAIYRGDLGCVLLRDPNSTIPEKISFENPSENIFLGLSPEDSLKYNFSLLDKGREIAFREKNLTRAMIILHKGKILTESYAEGFDKQTMINGWSMTKSITSTLVGILVKKGVLSIQDSNLFDTWKDERNAIKVKDLLKMQSGLYFEESYDELSTATNMLFRSECVADIPMDQDAIFKPGEKWYYSSGTTNLLSQLMRNTLGDSAYYALVYEELFHRIGMNTAVLESDQTGTFIGSSFCFARPREWAQLGQLYLQYGFWNGQQIIDSSWVEFVQRPAEKSTGRYGGHFWLNAYGSIYPKLPHNMYFCSGFQGQRIFIFPSQDLVVVRMGLSENWDMQAFLLTILESLEK